ncbi:MAG: phosphopantothenoylcysteine decarboxylase, partial [Prochlorococcaceae cyanobacterium]
GLQTHPVESGAAMGQALEQLQPAADAVAMAAAVADHSRATPELQKLSKQDLLASLGAGWCEVPDLLAQLVARRTAGQRILGFAAHSGEVLPQARAKFQRKGCDLLFANPIDQLQAGFGGNSNQGWLLGPGERELRIQPAGKFAVAHQLISALGALLDPLTQPAEAPGEGLAGRRAAADP